MIKGVVFDLDHTLYDRFATLDQIIPSFLRRFRDWFSPGLSDEQLAEIIKDYDRRYIHYEWEVLVSHLAADGLFAKPVDWREYQNALRQGMMEVAVPYPFTRPTLDLLRQEGMKLGIITNGVSDVQWAKLRLLGLEDSFDAVIVTGDFGAEKPDRAPFDAMASQLQLQSSELLYVGDNPLNDVEGARNAGYTPVWVRTMGFWTMPEVSPSELSADTIEEIPELVRKLNTKS